ncbi:nucleotidyltransferase family protein [Aureibacillus halotolerans]|uniref:Polymerase nucleotidyl transferase domain-containing protein n=1 Tax=Aureibacillus halotolerans TaxID=1508390 RepID=A0A4R6UBK4_9BACI|nr:nucleotidyltransferase family protein [Aureibacillus halotolerans]TDQ42359.1 hypothetical protein EV213_102393 [Aureibacillus halotolerans]
MNGHQLLSNHRHEVLSFAKENGIVNVRLFGSTARGEDHNESDIDLLVDIEDGCTLFDVIRFKQSVEDLLGKRIDVVSEHALHQTIRGSVLDEAVDL